MKCKSLPICENRCCLNAWRIGSRSQSPHRILASSSCPQSMTHSGLKILTRLASDTPKSIPAQGTSIPVAGWGDAAVIVPWMLYQRYGDAGVLAAQFDSMRAWVNLVAHAADGYLWNRGFQLGDWLDPAAPPNRPAATRTNPYVIATAYFAHSAELLGQAAGILGRTEEEAHYLQLAAHV